MCCCLIKVIKPSCMMCFFLIFFYLILQQDSIMYHMLEISPHKREQPPPTVTKKVKVKVLAIHPVCQNGRVSCLFPAGIHREFKASGISDNLPFSLLLPFGPIILGCLISDGKDQRPLPPSYTFHLPALTSRQICHLLKGIKYVHNSIVFSTEKLYKVVLLIDIGRLK